ncbi:DEAD/DEAH box helicase [Rhodoferax sp.]|uniref:DEAD/DEAH box helicase n=1 Tax=Rhodoferax sp. TaxID=50421 RepID=UPI0025FB2876|nr:DEAD/DEAH box helicase [Rhodoferax sp.]
MTGPWFGTQSLASSIDRATWDRGLTLYLTQKVLSLEIKHIGDYWQLQATVQGSQRWPYQVSIELTFNPNGEVANWDSDCSCPVGYQCKHGVAVLLKAAQQGRRLMDPSVALSASAPAAPTPEQVEALRQAALARAADQARREAEAPLLHWLQELNQASRHRAQDGAAAPTVFIHEHYLYLLSVAGAKGRTPEMQMDVVVSYPKVNGGWAKPKALRIPPARGQSAFDQATEVDQELLQLMRALPSGSSGYYSYGYKAKVTLHGKLGVMALQQAASTGRLLFDSGKGLPGTSMQWGPTQDLRWEWHEVASPSGDEPTWALRARLASAGAQLCLNTPPLYLDAANGLCGLVQADGVPAAQLAVLLKAPALKPSALKAHQGELLQQLGPVPAPPVLEQLPTLSGITPRACLHIAPVPPQSIAVSGLLQVQLRFDYAGHRGWWAGLGGTVLMDDAQGRVLLHRDLEAELDAITRLAAMGLRSGEQGSFGIPGHASQQNWLQWADEGFAAFKAAGFELTLDPALIDWISHADALNVKLRGQGEDDDGTQHAHDSHAGAPAEGGEDFEDGATSPWFDLSLGMEINGVRHNILPWLPTLIAQAATSPLDADTGLPTLAPFIFVPNSTGQGFIRLPTDALKPWMEALLELVGERSHDFSGESLKLSRLDAMRTTAALGEGAVWDGAQALRQMVKQLSGHTELPEVPVPASVQASLRPYQQQGVNWLQFLRQYSLGGILADDMGLGKTLQTLVHIQIEKDAGRLKYPALIVAPVSLMGNWQREAARFCPGLRSLVLHGKDRHELADSLHDHDIVITPYSLLERDRERWLKTRWHVVVLDEAQNIKNASTQAAQVASQLRARQRLCLSGTPMENHLGEIWSLFHFLMPGFLGSQKKFGDLFRTPIEKLGNPERLEQLRARVTPFMLRRTKALVAGELPPKIETVMRVELSGKQADLYETIRLGMEKSVREALDTKGMAKSQITILDALLKLRQVCCDPHLVTLAAAKKVSNSAKLERLMEMLPEMLAEGRRILLFSQFTTMLKLIEAELEKRGILWVKLTGQSQKRDSLIEQFTSGAVPLFLISLKAGGVGLNLPQADTVIHYDPWWNPAVENQATDRAHRIGQTQSVWVVKLVAQGTIEERILGLQERKAALAESMYSGSVGRKQPLFSESDLAELLKPLSV